MDSMQAEALRRAQEMHQGQRRKSTGYDTPQKDKPPKSSDHHKETNSARKEEPVADTNGSFCESPQNNFAQKSDFSLHGLFEDKEKLLILVLILILISEEKSDTYTVLALLYLII